MCKGSFSQRLSSCSFWHDSTGVISAFCNRYYNNIACEMLVWLWMVFLLFSLARSVIRPESHIIKASYHLFPISNRWWFFEFYFHTVPHGFCSLRSVCGNVHPQSAVTRLAFPTTTSTQWSENTSSWTWYVNHTRLAVISSKENDVSSYMYRLFRIRFVMVQYAALFRQHLSFMVVYAWGSLHIPTL